MQIIYPLKFCPIFKEKIWGGLKLTQFLNKNVQKKNIGESWEISSVPQNVSIVKEGKLAGKTLTEVIQIFKARLLGDKIYTAFETNFPLLIKFIDAAEDLSVQVHPTNKIAKERHGENGKTEMWYIVQADNEAKLISGVKKNVTHQIYKQKLKENEITSILNFEQAQKGDVFFIPAGRIHAIGKGILLAEIQQTSDITYRIHDWNRPDINGKMRQLHTKEAEQAIDFTYAAPYKSGYTKELNKTSKLISCPYFLVNYLSFSKQINKNYSTLDSFVIYMCTEGGFNIECETGTYSLQKGETILLPACIKKYTLLPSESSVILEIYL